MQDLKETRDQFLVTAADCELISILATDTLKRDAFRRLAEQLRRMAVDIEAVIAEREAREAA